MPNASSAPITLPQTIDEWALSLPEEDRKRLTTILVYTPFAREFLQKAWAMGFQQALAANLDNHVIEFRKSGWTIMHPLSCRPDLFKCKVNRAAEVQITNAPKELGRFRCELDDDGQFVVGARAD